MAFSALQHLTSACQSSLVFLSSPRWFLFPMYVVFMSAFLLLTHSYRRAFAHGFPSIFKAPCRALPQAFQDPTNLNEASPCFLLCIFGWFSFSSMYKHFLRIITCLLFCLKSLFFFRPRVPQIQGPCPFPSQCMSDTE